MKKKKKRIIHSMQIHELFVDGWIKKMWHIYMYIYIYIYTHTHNRILFSRDKEGNPAICDNMDELRGYYAKQNKPNPERQILHDLTYTES